MMQRMFETGGAPAAETVLHVDRCLSCLGCRTACPSSVDYARLVDTARAHIHAHYARPLRERLLRGTIALVMARPALVKFAMMLARMFAPIASRLPGAFGAMARKSLHTPWPGLTRPPSSASRFWVAGSKAGHGEYGEATRRVALMPGCVQQALAPEIDLAAARVLARRGIALKKMGGAGCCGALAHHLGRRDEAKAWARLAIEAFEKAGAVNAVLITATGCAAHLADYADLFCDEPGWQARAERFAAKVRDFSELATPRPAAAPETLRIAFHTPCSLQHGLRRGGLGEAALRAAGFEVHDIREGHLCCGSAGSYSLLQPEIAGTLRGRKLAAIAELGADAVASANIGCLTHLSGPDAPPIVHPAELIDWAEGGPRPRALGQAKSAVVPRKTG